MRLIDADELITITEIREDGQEYTYVSYSDIEKAPTVYYDIDKVVEKLENYDTCTDRCVGRRYCYSCKDLVIDRDDAIEIVKDGYRMVERENHWISTKERLPEVETEVLICVVEIGCDGKEYKTVTTAIYEDGTVPEENSHWLWEDIDGEWDENTDSRIIPKGWWKYRHFNPDEDYNNVIDKNVVAWMPLPEPYKESD